MANLEIPTLENIIQAIQYSVEHLVKNYIDKSKNPNEILDESIGLGCGFTIHLENNPFWSFQAYQGRLELVRTVSEDPLEFTHYAIKKSSVLRIIEELMLKESVQLSLF